MHAVSNTKRNWYVYKYAQVVCKSIINGGLKRLLNEEVAKGQDTRVLIGGLHATDANLFTAR
jgi:hypothetical protein